MEENAAAFFIYGLVSDQVIVAPMGGVIGVMDMAVESVMRVHGTLIKDQAECHLKVKAISRTILAEQAKKKDAEKK